MTARQETAAPTVVVYSDIGCPWASLALHHLRRAAAAAAVRIDVAHRAFPLELFNARPTPRRILDPEIEVVAELEPALGWAPWSGEPSDYPASTLPAMEAVQAAGTPAVGGPAAADQLDAALRHAFYGRSRCITVHAEILAVAETCPAVDAAALDAELRTGVHRAALFAHWREASGPAVQGSPHLFLPDGTDLHNPGVTFTWPRGAPRPVVTRYAPQVWDDIVRRVQAAGAPAP